MPGRLRSVVRLAAVASVVVLTASLLVGVQPAAARTVPICFPVIERDQVIVTDSFGDPRGGGTRTHEGVDIMGKRMFRLVAPVDGEILSVRWRGTGHSDHSVRMRGDDGIYYAFLHMNNDRPGTDDGLAPRNQVFGPGIGEGKRVYAGQLIGYMGDSGNAEGTSPHLHFEMRSGSGIWSSTPFDAYPSLQAARPCGDGTIGHRDITQLIPGDFDGDGKGEMFAYVPGPGRDRVYAGQSDRTLRTFDTQNVGGTYQPLTGDFDNDGRDDILWYGPGSTPESVWYGTAQTGKFVSRNAPAANGDYKPLLGDFDGDGYGDILWYAPGPASDYVWYGSGKRGEFSSYPTVANGVYEPFTGDFDGDGITDVMWYGPGAAPDYTWYGTGQRGQFVSHKRVSNGHYEPFTGDFNGDGIDDIYWYAPGAARDHVWYGRQSRGSHKSVNLNVDGTYSPVAVDLDGDGRDDIFWWSKGTALTPAWFGHRAEGTFVSLRI